MELLIDDPELEKIVANSNRRRRLGKYLNKLDERKRTNGRSDQRRVEIIQAGIESIVGRLVKRVGDKCAMFKGTLENMGSYYEGLKVGPPDEFDYMLVLSQWSTERGSITFRPTKTPPGFAALQVNGGNVSRDWPVAKYCPKHETFKQSPDFPTIQCNCFGYMIALDPFKVQQMYRELADEVMFAIELPNNWCHGGFNRPDFSGHRKNGPATLFQFVYRDGDGEIKITIDLTLAIRLTTGFDLKLLGMNLLEKFNPANFFLQKLTEHLLSDPGIHVIPLYSKYLIEEGHASKKYNWKVSGSCSEKKIFQSMPENAILKKMIRVLKILRDEHLTYYKRKTERRKKPNRAKKKKQQTNEANRNLIHQDDDDDDDEDDDDDDVSSTSNGILAELDASGLCEHFDKHLNISASQDRKVSLGNRPQTARRNSFHGKEDDTTDLTEVETQSNQEAARRYKEKAPLYQRRDIGLERITPEPGSGEYWGARHYISSVEFKTLALKMLFGEINLIDPDGRLIDYAEPGNDEMLALLVVYCIDYFLKQFREKRTSKNVYFDCDLVTSLSSHHRRNALMATGKIVEEFIKESSPN